MRGVWGRALCLSGAVIVAGRGAAGAQDRPDAAAPVAPRAAEQVATLDFGDLWRMARHKDAPADDAPKRVFVFSPSIGSKPSTGFNVGFSGNVVFFEGDPQTTHISSVTGGVKFSQKKQTL